MAGGAFTLYNAFAEKLGQALIDLENGDFYMTLHTSSYSPSVSSDDDYADLTNELTTASGYTVGGTLLDHSWSRTGNVNKFTLDTAASWMVSGGDLTAKTAVVHCAIGTGDNPLVGFFTLKASGADAVIKDGTTFTVTAAANGLFTLTG